VPAYHPRKQCAVRPFRPSSPLPPPPPSPLRGNTPFRCHPNHRHHGHGHPASRGSGPERCGRSVARTKDAVGCVWQCPHVVTRYAISAHFFNMCLFDCVVLSRLNSAHLGTRIMEVGTNTHQSHPSTSSAYDYNHKKPSRPQRHGHAGTMAQHSLNSAICLRTSAYRRAVEKSSG